MTAPTGTGTFAPRPGAAPYPKMVAAQARMETRLLLRNGEQLLLAVVIPLIVLVGGLLASRRFDLGIEGRPVDLLVPGVLALAVMSTSFTSLAISTGFERRYGVLKRLGSSPLPRSGLLLGKVGALLVVELLQLIVLGGAGLLLGWRPDLTAACVIGAVLVALLGTAAFAALGLLLAGTLRAEATLAAANLVYLVLLMCGGIVIPLDKFGGAAEVLELTPAAALATGLRDVFTGADATPWGALLVLTVWALAALAAAARWFRWE